MKVKMTKEKVDSIRSRSATAGQLMKSPRGLMDHGNSQTFFRGFDFWC